MITILADVLALAHIPVGAYLVYRCFKALRSVTDKDVRFAIECVLALSAGVIAVRLTDYTAPLDGDARLATWRTVVTLTMLAFVPLINALARVSRRPEN